MRRVIVLTLVASMSCADPYKLWPKPKVFDKNKLDDECSLTGNFRFEISPVSAVASTHVGRLLEATQRTNDMISNIFRRFTQVSIISCPVTTCVITVENPFAPLTKRPVAEAYIIAFDSQSCQLTCNTAYGCIAGLGTFIQLVNPVRDYLVPSGFTIKDEPEFAVRGLMLDTSRHFIPVSDIKKTIELMAMTKLNVFQWHIVDDHSFPLVIESLPRLSSQGAFSPAALYSRFDVQEIIRFAESRGIRVIPEIDMPGHTDSWFKGYPELRGKATNGIDPTIPANYDFIRTLLSEVVDIFRSDMLEGKLEVHLGGDELWSGWDNAEIGEWMSRNKMSTQTDLIQYWLANVATIANDLSIQVILWEDFLETTNNNIGNSDAESPFIWQTWKRNLLNTITLSQDIGRETIFSSMFYISNTDWDWVDFYSQSMVPAIGTRVVGGVAAVWAEAIDHTNLIQATWPEAAAIGERLWCGSYCSLDPSIDATIRLARWRCRVTVFYGMAAPEPVGALPVDNPDIEWKWSTDMEQFWCEEQDLPFLVRFKG